MKRIRPKSTRNNCWHPLGLILALVGLMSAFTFVLEPVALAGVDPSWIPTGNLNSPRSGHSATLLPNGKVLVVGGNSSELYDPATGTWSVTGSLNTPRYDGFNGGEPLHTATLLPNGKVLVAGGITNTTPPDFGITTSAEVYDPATGNWSATGSLNIARFWHTATLLQNGKVLVAGGGGGDNSAELYDPATGTWSITGSLMAARYGQTATLLQNGKVLIAGGSDDGDLASTLASAELYDPATGTWSVTGNLNTSRFSHTATLLPDGKVLAAGGFTIGSQVRPVTELNSAELYDPANGTWSIAASLNTARDSHTATLLPNGKVLVAAGGYWTANPPYDNALSSAELYDSATGVWTITAGLNTARFGHTATLLQNGQVLIAGGDDTGNILNSAELYSLGDDTAIEPIGTGDVDGDRKADLIWYNAGTGTTGVWLMNGTSMVSGSVLLTNPDWKVIGAGDFDGDGKADLIWYNAGSGETAVWLMNGISMVSGSVLLTNPEWKVIGTGDLDGDGKADLIWYKAGTGETAVWLMNGTSMVSGSVLLTNPDWKVIATGDLNGDGKADLIWYNAGTGETAVWLMNGTSMVSGAVLLTNPDWKVIGAGDFDGDGKADLTWYNASTGATAVWLMNGTSMVSGAVLLTNPDWKVIGAGDFDGDGKADLIWYNAGTGETAVWLMNGTSMVSGGVLLTNPDWKLTGY